MTREEKTAVIEEIKDIFASSNCFYVTDCSTLSVEQVNKLRRSCFETGIQLRVIKNTLIRKALEQVSENDYSELYDSLHGPTAIMFSENAKAPATLIKQFRETAERPLLKAAYIDSSIFVGDDQLEALTKLKSKEELLGDVIGLLQSPMKNVIGALKSGGQTIAGLVKALEERAS